MDGENDLGSLLKGQKLVVSKLITHEGQNWLAVDSVDGDNKRSGVLIVDAVTEVPVEQQQVVEPEDGTGDDPPP